MAHRRPCSLDAADGLVRVQRDAANAGQLAQARRITDEGAAECRGRNEQQRAEFHWIAAPAARMLGRM